MNQIKTTETEYVIAGADTPDIHVAAIVNE
jgi:hypothetical protein